MNTITSIFASQHNFSLGSAFLTPTSNLSVALELEAPASQNSRVQDEAKVCPDNSMPTLPARAPALISFIKVSRSFLVVDIQLVKLAQKQNKQTNKPPRKPTKNQTDIKTIKNTPDHPKSRTRFSRLFLILQIFQLV